MIQSSLWEVCEERSMTVCRLRKQTTPLRLLLHRASVLSLRAFQLHACSAVLNFFSRRQHSFHVINSEILSNNTWGLVHFFIALSTLLLSTRIYFLIVLFSSFQGMMTVMVRGKFSGWKLIYDQYQLSRREALKYLRFFSELFLFFCFFGQFTSLCAQLLPISRTIFFGDF